MTQTRKHSRPARSAYSICREWRQVHLKAAYEGSVADEHDDEATALIFAVADATKHELERDLHSATMTIVDDPHAVLGIALTLLGEGIFDGRIACLVGIARRGIVEVSNAGQRRAA